MRKFQERDGETAIPAPFWHELRFGCIRLPPSRRRQAIERYIESVVLTSLPVLDYDRDVADWHALGKTPPLVAGQMAAITHVNDLILVTLCTGDFENFRGMQVWELGMTANLRHSIVVVQKAGKPSVCGQSGTPERPIRSEERRTE